jgi:hypothetical protein
VAPGSASSPYFNSFGCHLLLLDPVIDGTLYCWDSNTADDVLILYFIRRRFLLFKENFQIDMNFGYIAVSINP